MEFSGRVGFLGFKHRAALEKKLAGPMPGILRSVQSNNISAVRRVLLPIAAEFAATFSLMALQARSKAKRRSAYSLMKHIVIRDREKDYSELQADDMKNLERIFGSREKAEEFWEIFVKNYSEIASAGSAIINREFAKQRQK